MRERPYSISPTKYGSRATFIPKPFSEYHGTATSQFTFQTKTEPSSIHSNLSRIESTSFTGPSYTHRIHTNAWSTALHQTEPPYAGACHQTTEGPQSVLCNATFRFKIKCPDSCVSL